MLDAETKLAYVKGDATRSPAAVTGMLGWTTMPERRGWP
jgi:hypothetical protein